jgi:hypothetical protein
LNPVLLERATVLLERATALPETATVPPETALKTTRRHMPGNDWLPHRELIILEAFTTAREKYQNDDSWENLLTKDETKEDAVDAMRDFANIFVRPNKKMSDADKLTLGIHPKDTTPTHHGTPTVYATPGRSGARNPPPARIYPNRNSAGKHATSPSTRKRTKARPPITPPATKTARATRASGLRYRN